MKQIKHRSDCPISFALDLFGDKWTLLIIRDLILRDKFHFGDFLVSEEKIATNILADRLQMLEHAGIIKKSRDPQNKTKYMYRLTKKGLDLLPILIEMVLWTAKHAPQIGTTKPFVMKNLGVRAREDKARLIKDITRDAEKKHLV